MTTVCKEWQGADGLFRGLCTNQLAPETGVSGCFACVHPLLVAGARCSKACPDLEFTFPGVINITLPSFEGNRGASSCVSAFNNRTYSLVRRQNPNQRCLYTTQMSEIMYFDTMTETCFMAAPGINQGLIQFDLINGGVTMGYAVGNLAASAIGFGDTGITAVDWPNGICTPPFLLVGGPPNYGSGAGITVHVKVIGKAIIWW